MSGLIDTHLHLDALEFGDEALLFWQQARALGVAAALVPAVEPCQWERQVAFAAQPGIALAWGVHPLFVDAAHAAAEAALGCALKDEEAVAWGIERLSEQCARFPTVAIGEIGLDGLKAPQPNRQQIWFEAQLRLAARLGLPVVIHARRAVEAVRLTLARIPVVGGIVHAFNGSFEQAADLARRGFLLGVGGAATQPRAQHLRRLARELPLAYLALETDAPDIPPAWARLRAQPITLPADLVSYAALVAEWRSLAIMELAEALQSNLARCFPALLEAAS